MTQQLHKQRIELVVLEGGPCGGKSTGIHRIKQHFKSLGWMVLVSAEVPTRLVDEHDYVPGVNISFEAFQELVLQEVLRQEESLKKRARESGHDKVLILCDRGRFGGLGYTDHASFYKMAIEKFGLSKNDLFREYSGCVFLESTAVDAPHVYLEYMTNNQARREKTVGEAVIQNNLSLDACVGVPRLFIIDNSTDFEQKITRVINVIEHLLAGVEYERKYVPFSPRTFDLVTARQALTLSHTHFVELAISQGYLTLSKADVREGITTRRLRTESLDGDKNPLYILTLKGEKKEGGGREEEVFISEVEHTCHLSDLDPKKIVIKKCRFLFVWGGRYCELDVFETPEEQDFILEIEHLPGENMSAVDLPFWLGSLKDGTNDSAYSNSNIAQVKRVG